MNRFEGLRRWAWSILVVSALAFAMGGCSGDDGQDGAAGPQGPQGPQGDPGDPGPAGPGASVIPFESCSVCHDQGSFMDAAAGHALDPIEMASNVTFAVDGADLDVTFDLDVDGAAGLGYDTVTSGYRTDGTTTTGICNAPSRGDPCDAALLSLEENGGGNYTLTVLGGAAEAGTDNRYLFKVEIGDGSVPGVYFYGDFPASPVESLIVSAESCEACHGPEGIAIHSGDYAMDDGGEPCLTCHGVFAFNRDVPRLVQVAHGYHTGVETWKPTLDEVNVTYPTYMNNCSVCHSPGAELTAANAMPVEADACFTCHGSTAGIPFTPGSPAVIIHENIVDGCEACHAGQIGGIPQTVTDAHNGDTTGRGGVIWDGVDTSVTEGALFDWEITGVADDGTDLTITWQATYNGVGVDPCNATPAAGAPAFHAIPPFTRPDGTTQNRNNLSILRNYAQGEDFILGLREDRVGQPNNDVDLDDINTSCAGNVATTVVPVEPTGATYGRVAIQGKPWVVAVDPDDEDGVMQVRAKTPTYDWAIGDGSAAPPRRDIADTSLCLKCHVGSLYQHGGNRVDNIDMCTLCHNSAANDEYVRVDTYGVDASEAYDGRAGQAFGIKEMVHAVHPAGALGNPLVIYRGRGIYGWASNVSQLSNWPAGDWPGDADDLPVFGSDDGTGNPVLQDHHFHIPTYPRGLYDCAACHVQDDPGTAPDEGFKLFPDATKAMATTVEAGAPPFEVQLNDVLEGVQTTSCVSCHADKATKGHAYQNSWQPQEFPEGRQTIIDAN